MYEQDFIVARGADLVQEIEITDENDASLTGETFEYAIFDRESDEQLFSLANAALTRVGTDAIRVVVPRATTSGFAIERHRHVLWMTRNTYREAIMGGHVVVQRGD